MTAAAAGGQSTNRARQGNMPVMDSPVVVCETCDAAYRQVRLPRGGVARCARCGAQLYRCGFADLDAMLAVTLGSLIVFAIANAYPIVTIDARGMSNATTLWGAILATWEAGVPAVAVLAGLTVLAFPLLQLTLYLYVLLPLRLGHRPRHFVGTMHVLRLIRDWSMVEVFMLGVLVAVVKLAGLAEVVPDTGLWGFAVLTLLLTALQAFDLRALWQIEVRPL